MKRNGRSIDNKNPAVLTLGARLGLFLIFGLLIAGVLMVLGKGGLKEAEKWWPIQAIAANIVTIIIIRRLAKNENIRYRDLINLNNFNIKKDIKLFFIQFFIMLVTGVIGAYLVAYLVFGSSPPTNMFQPIPLWAAIISMIFFPITNALAELPLYLGYCMPRNEIAFSNKTSALLASVLFLSLQHVALPIIFNLSFFVYRLFQFLLLALVIGIMYQKTRRLWILMIGHYLMDLALPLGILMIILQ